MTYGVGFNVPLHLKQIADEVIEYVSEVRFWPKADIDLVHCIRPLSRVKRT